jgi:Nucleotidyltransferase domain
MHLYAFGSVCRGDITHDSDIDLLALVSGHNKRLDPAKYSIYSYNKMKAMWQKGNPFAWHLSIESRLLYSEDDHDFLKSLGLPAPYSNCHLDCRKFYGVYLEALSSLDGNMGSGVFDLSALFLSVRNIATCFALGVLGQTLFSRHAALKLPSEFELPISRDCYRILERARILCTRSIGTDISTAEIQLVRSECESINRWMKSLTERAEKHG